MNFSPDAAELELLFHKNDPHIGCDSRLDHLKAIESKYELEMPALGILNTWNLISRIFNSRAFHTPK